MEDELKWIVVGVLVFFGMLIGAGVYSEIQETALKLECMKQHGDWMGKACIFREHAK